MFNLDYF
ncbi:hypothetical protein BIW11_07636 [Tropilaelaps mercedesae]|nr:hypothetical protein BIW11_07636 [Tropilaelaps mercedesae]